jgi:type I restriction enzyme S subunit
MDLQAEGLTPVQVLGVGHVLNDGNLDVQSAPVRYLNQSELECVAQEGDLLVVKSSGSATNIHSGKTAICPLEFTGRIACSNFMMLLRPAKDRVEPRWLWRYLNSHDARAFVQLIAGSSTYPNIKWSSYKNLLVPVPPLSEQQRIVAKLDEQIAALDRAEKALAEVQAAASAFTTVALQQVFSGSESGRWPQVRLGEVAASDLTQVPPDDEFAKDLPYIGMEDIESQTGRIIAQSAHSDVRSNTFAFDERHVLYGKLRPYLNKVALPESRGRCSTELIPLRPEARLDRRYLAWFLRRPETVSAAMQEKTGSRMPRASMKNIGQLHIPLPPLSHQRQVVASLERISAELASLQQHFADQRTDLAVLRSSLLNAAFSGEARHD